LALLGVFDDAGESPYRQHARMRAMTIVLTPEQEAAVERLVEGGLFASKDAAIARSLDWLREETEKFEAIRRRIEESMAQSARGESRPVDAHEIMRRDRKRLQDEIPPTPTA